MEVKNKTICLSGGFDPLHKGHVDMISDAATYGKVIIILNSDAWLARKKGYVFQDWEHRYRILAALRDVYRVVSVKDEDGSVCEALRRLKPDYFANGGDRKDGIDHENAVCEELGIEVLFGIGGEKTSSSSELVSNASFYFP